MADSPSVVPVRKKVAAIPSESELVEFDHSAAGHEGISSNASGSLIIKPCTQAEIDFYESAKDHPLFLAHIPTFIGSLSQNEDQEAVRPLLDAAPASISSPQDGSRAGAGAGTTDTPPELVKRTSWKPSGGKKLSTGLAIVLENVAAGFQHPNVLDVKLGVRLWADDAPLAKRRKLDEVAQSTTSGSLGFRIAGMKLWYPPRGRGGEGGSRDRTSSQTAERGEERDQPDTDENDNDNDNDEPNVEWKRGYKNYTKLYGQSFSKDNVADAFTTYLGGVQRDEQTGKSAFKRKRAALIVKRLIRELESIQYVLENEESRMYSASVLMVYEGDELALELGLQEEQQERERERNRQVNHGPDGTEMDHEDDDDGDIDDDDDDDDDDSLPQKVHEARLIDFAHASWTPGQGPDENALIGIRSILDILRSLVE